MSLPKVTDTPKSAFDATRPNLPPEFLNCYEIVNASALTFPIRLYKVRRADGRQMRHLDRAMAKDAFWSLRKLNRHHCHGFGYLVDVGVDSIMVPTTWEIPSNDEAVGDFLFSFDRSVEASATNPAHAPFIEGILREALKRHFKENSPQELGQLWQDFVSFCQMPNLNRRGDFYFCRRFTVAAKHLAGHHWVIEIVVNTSTLDAKTFRDYYGDCKVRDLARLIEAKQANRLNRRNQPVAVRVWRDESDDYQDKVTVMELADPDSVVAHGDLTRQEQRDLVEGGVQCKRYKQQPGAVPMDQVRLILDSQITLEDHDETIIDPNERVYLEGLLRDAAAKADIYDASLQLAKEPLATSVFPGMSVLPPAVRVRDKERGAKLIKSPSDFTGEAIRKRSRYRAKQIRENGFLHLRPVNLLLAAPKSYGPSRAGKLKVNLNHILKWQGIKYRFNEFILYRSVNEIARKVEDDNYTAAMVVLPEGARAATHNDDTHEQVKRILEVPSQCIHHDNTLPATWADKKFSEFRAAQPRLANRISDRYQLCLGNLLVKCHWVSFAPAEPYHYNVHVGIDVGGRHNNTAMVCIGHGFANHRGAIIFRPDQIPIDVQQAEPIPTQFLLAGLRQPFQAIETNLREANTTADFNRVLFFRDGSLLGDDDAWNELDALTGLHAEFFRKGWVTEDSVWTAVEVLKSAEGWRIMRNGQGMEGNPVVGRAIFPFDDDMMGLVCTTGQPYLTQGTARPLKIRIVDIYGNASREDVVRDVVWEADMCLSKPDMGMRLPWILHIADTGALQAARSYTIAGIPS